MKGLFLSDYYNLKRYVLFIVIGGISAVAAALIMKSFVTSEVLHHFSSMIFSVFGVISLVIGTLLFCCDIKFMKYSIASAVKPSVYLTEKYIFIFAALIVCMFVSFGVNIISEGFIISNLRQHRTKHV